MTPGIPPRKSARRVEPEILDNLPPDAEGVREARRDLRRINAIMGNHRWIRSALQRLVQPDDRVVELGAGDGSLALRARDVIRNASGSRYSALDLAPPPHDWPGGLEFEWIQGDWRESCARHAPDVVVANLFFHHFDDAELRAGAAAFLASARVIICREPARHRAWMRHLLLPLGLHPITRHDMAVSIRAGFLHSELPQALGLDKNWRVRVRHTLFGAYEMTALRATGGTR
ncbi:MAG: class I SAM-dependent methyltransferase [Chthoniobacterales bacterium]|nr:class I SAM-dependent methyltransferase [Chthoniobacterales bacterium]